MRNSKSIYSYRDAQGFRKGENEKLTVANANARIFHYGWVKEPAAMQAKQENFHKMWHSDDWVETNVKKAAEFDYTEIDVLERFAGTHPEVMKKRLVTKNWKFDYDISQNNLKWKDKIKLSLSKILGYMPFEYKNYLLRK